MKPTKCRIVCPDCGKPKMQFETESAAKKFIQFNGKELINDTSKLRVYYCQSCCCYHITSKKKNSYQKLNTAKLLDAYYEENGDKAVVIDNIKQIITLEPDIVIPRTGWRKIVRFRLEDDNIFGISYNEHVFSLHKLMYCDLVCMLKKLCKLHWKLERKRAREKNEKTNKNRGV